MLFNSLGFAVFLPIVFVAYWFLAGKLKHQNLLLLVASYYFYSCWDYRFLFLLVFSTCLDFYTGHKISQSEKAGTKRLWLFISIIVNIGVLALFKYYNFFATSFADVLHSLGLKSNVVILNIILPVGISFYTFHGLSYVLDIYHKRTEPTKNFINYSLFVSFFPLLVAGPIERATHLLPQIERPRKFLYSQAATGMRQILWGLVKKILIADNCAVYVNQIFDNSDQYSGSTLALGAILFAFQIYGDFSGYTDIALGTARLFGFELLQNFKYPYFSRNIAEFWRRWHISLSSWFKDYLYYPLGGSRRGLSVTVRNTFIIFIVSGIWHGANWTFVAWGFLNALFIIPSILLNRGSRNSASMSEYPRLGQLPQMLATFGLTTFAWIFFRANNLEHAGKYIQSLFSSKLFAKPEILPISILLWIALFTAVEWAGRKHKFAIEHLGEGTQAWKRWCLYFIIIMAVYFGGNFGQSIEFIYFQF